MPRDPNSLKQIPYFSREKKVESDINLHFDDLYSIGQIEANEFDRIKKERESSFKSERDDI